MQRRKFLQKGALSAGSLLLARFAMAEAFPGKKLFPTAANLTSIDATLLTGADGLDSNSTLLFILHPTVAGTRYATWRVSGGDGTGGTTNPGNKKTGSFELIITPLTREQINNHFYIDVIITALGRDHYEGNLSCTFHFDDNSTGGFTWDFHVGTFKEGSQDGHPVSFP